MHTTDLSAAAFRRRPSRGYGGQVVKADVPLSPEERLREIAAILAAGLLRLRIRPQLAAPADMSSQPAAPKECAESSQKPLGLPAPPRPDPHAG